jgi:hypothetical protein
MTVAEQIARFLAAHGGQGFCDQCLGRQVKARSAASVQRATKQMAATPAYRRDHGVCARCGNGREIILALWPGF